MPSADFCLITGMSCPRLRYRLPLNLLATGQWLPERQGGLYTRA